MRGFIERAGWAAFLVVGACAAVAQDTPADVEPIVIFWNEEMGGYYREFDWREKEAPAPNASPTTEGFRWAKGGYHSRGEPGDVESGVWLFALEYGARATSVTVEVEYESRGHGSGKGKQYAFFSCQAPPADGEPLSEEARIGSSKDDAEREGSEEPRWTARFSGLNTRTFYFQSRIVAGHRGSDQKLQRLVLRVEERF